MSVGPMGMAGGFAGAPLSQTQGSEIDRSQQLDASQARQARGDEKAEQAAGIGTTEEDQKAGDRDADGRRLWEAPPEKPAEETDESDEASANAVDPHASKDPTGQSGTQLDLSG